MPITSFITALAVALTGTIAVAQKVTFDFDRGTDFSKFRTYAWVHGTELRDPFNHDRVVTAVSEQLAARRIVRVDASTHPDLLVAYHAVFDRDLQITGFSTGWGPYRLGPRTSGVARTEQILTGTLIVDLVDGDTKTIVWRGTASKEIDAKAAPDKRERNINRATARLFVNFPPVK